MDNNPLRQYFRRPAVYIKLPSGDNYSPEEVIIPETGELPVYPMTAIDEISIRTPDALFNGTAIVDLIKSCVPAIINPWALKSSDIDAVLIGIRAASGNETLDIDSMCPSCEEISQYQVHLVSLLSGMKAGDYETELQLGDISVKLKPLTYYEINAASKAQIDLQKSFIELEKIEDQETKNKLGYQTLEKITLLTIELIAKSIAHVKTTTTLVTELEYILDFLKHCDRNTYNTIRDHYAKLKSESEVKPMDVKCPHCNHEYEQAFELNPTDFFG
jgi:phage FluMu protein Com